MRPTELKVFATAAIKARQPILVCGPPGCGKTDILSQAATDAGAEIILSHPAVSDPTDAKGLPWAEQGATQAKFLPFGDLAQAVHATRPTVWFLDDLGQAPPSVQASYMQLLLARKVNDHKLPDCVTFVAATNRRTDKAGVSGILEPVKSRFAAIVELETHLDDWCQWAFGASIPPELIAFLRFKPNLLCHFEASNDLTNSPLPRTWAHVARIMDMALPHGIESAAISGAVGAGPAAEFGAFRRLFAQLPNIDGILLDPKSGKIPTEPAALYSVVTALGMRANVENIPRIGVYAERLMKAQHGEFAALLMRDAVRRDEGILNTSAFLKLASGDLGKLISGGEK